MIDLKKLTEMLQKKENPKEYPKHLVINLFPLVSTEEKKKEDYSRFLGLVNEIIDIQLERDIPILTLNLGKTEDILDQPMLKGFFFALLEKAVAKKIDVTAFGRWYSLSGELVDMIKKVNNETGDFDSFFLNFCINYDGKQEIADSSRVIIRKVISEKADVDSISPEMLKENISSSYFIPPELVIEPQNRFSGTFLFDSAGAKILFLNRNVSELAKQDIAKALDASAQK